MAIPQSQIPQPDPDPSDSPDQHKRHASTGLQYPALFHPLRFPGSPDPVEFEVTASTTPFGYAKRTDEALCYHRRYVDPVPGYMSNKKLHKIMLINSVSETRSEKINLIKAVARGLTAGLQISITSGPAVT